jgi:hypothetical protein
VPVQEYSSETSVLESQIVRGFFSFRQNQHVQLVLPQIERKNVCVGPFDAEICYVECCRHPGSRAQLAGLFRQYSSETSVLEILIVVQGFLFRCGQRVQLVLPQIEPKNVRGGPLYAELCRVE